MSKPTCGKCALFRYANKNERRPWGACTAKRPVWTIITGDVAPYASDLQARKCECYKERKRKP